MTNRDHLYSRVEALERRLGIPTGFTQRLNREDDWSFVIKAHALAEAVVTHFLTHATDTRLEDTFSRLQLGGGKTGKLAFVKALDLLTPASQRFVDKLSALRNGVVHRVENAGFTFESHFSSLTPGDLRAETQALFGAFGHYVDNLVADDAALLKRHAQGAIHLALLSVTLDAYYRLLPQAGDFDAEMAMLVATFGIFLIVSEEDFQSRRSDNYDQAT